ncbi:TspO/MBR family protein [Aurantiacibacter gangjinensis]|uniref:CrtK protein n=1 Tax=Aurantiacibacter gangjinensis TaxID=502682 RepID=A0A0G9MP81_9SPHN|nr:TspO/MBR family protein [Aurantiacibacter gangjinensis]APE28290.1 CrtK protein [Aurantiacibacter gangjinensis]KLE32531.1 CrtK protein [Aurantiacibacter gangjinensis]
MNRLASPGQLRASLLRWSLFIIPAVMLLGFLSGTVGGDANSAWFQSLEKPAIYPPPATFGIVWSILYFMMGLAFAMVCAAWGSPYRGLAIIVFVTQFLMNLAWTPVFFGAQMIENALYVIIGLALALVVTTYLFFRVRKWAGILMLPYLAWVLFAAVLNWQFLQLNPDADGMDRSGAQQRIEL